MKRIPETYLDVLRKYGRSFLEIGVHEVGLPREAALEAIKFLYQSEIAILGGDVYRIVNGRPEPDYSFWDCEQENNERHENYVQRSIEVTERYISNYPDPEDGTVLYSIVLSDDANLQIAKMVEEEKRGQKEKGDRLL